jgi:arsenate reductase
MREIGVDISGHRSKTLDGFVGQPWDYVITVCDQANERCPLFPGRAQRIHWSFEDPSARRAPTPSGSRCFAASGTPSRRA